MKKHLSFPLSLFFVGFVILSGCLGQAPEEKTTMPPQTTRPPTTIQPPLTTSPPPATTPAPATQVPRTTPLSTQPSVSTFTMDEVAKHGTRNDCWLVIHDNVYDITQFIASHPGGSVIAQGCGKDATVFFETRPMGSGTAHSQRARDLLAKYFIGVLVKV